MEHAPQKSHNHPLKAHYSVTCFSEPNQSQVSPVVGRAVPSQSTHPTVPNTTCLSKSIKIWQIRWLSPKYSPSLQQFGTQELPQSEAVSSYLMVLSGSFFMNLSCAVPNSSRLVASTTFCSEELDSISEEMSPLQDPLPLCFILWSFGFVSGETTNKCCQFTLSMTFMIS